MRLGGAERSRRSIRGTLGGIRRRALQAADGLEAAHADVEIARSGLALVGSGSQTLKSDAASERATLIAEREAARTEAERLVAEIRSGTGPDRAGCRRSRGARVGAGHAGSATPLVAVRDEAPQPASPQSVAAWLMASSPDSAEAELPQAVRVSRVVRRNRRRLLSGRQPRRSGGGGQPPSSLRRARPVRGSSTVRGSPAASVARLG